MLVEKLQINQLIPYVNNARTHSSDQIAKIASSIKEFGFNNPILIDKQKGIIAGHGRLEAAKLLNLETVPVIELTHLSESQKKAYILADNRMALDAGWNIELLKLEFEDLKDFDLSLTGFSEEEINLYLNPEELNEGLCDPDEVPEIQQEPITKLGDIWILGNHRLMCGDSTMIDDVEKLYNGNSPILMVTDPPYGVNHDPSWRDEYCIGKRGFSDKHANSKGLVENDDNADWKEAYSLFPGDVVYIWHSAKFTALLANNLIDCGFNLICQIIWAKQHFSFGRGDYHWQHEPCWYAVKEGKKHNYVGDRKQTTLWQIESLNPIGQLKSSEPKQEKTGHSIQKPIECMSRPIQNNSKPNDNIYDPFGGSGTTLIACEKLGRKCYMMEILPQYCDVIVKRWEKFTGKKAVLSNVAETA